MDQIQLLGCGYACPKQKITNQHLETLIDTSDEWIVQRTGIHARYVATKETTSYLAAQGSTGGNQRCKDRSKRDQGLDRCDINGRSTDAEHCLPGSRTAEDDGSAIDGV